MKNFNFKTTVDGVDYDISQHPSISWVFLVERPSNIYTLTTDKKTGEWVNVSPGLSKDPIDLNKFGKIIEERFQYLRSVQ